MIFCSITRKPIRSKGRQSSLSVYSVTTLSSEDGGQHEPQTAATIARNNTQAEQRNSVQLPFENGESLV